MLKKMIQTVNNAKINFYANNNAILKIVYAIM